MDETKLLYVRFNLEPWCELLYEMSDEQFGKLLKAAIEYADTNGKKEPDFKDDAVLSAHWMFERVQIDRDMNRVLTKREWRSYWNYVRVRKRRGIAYLSFEGWKSAGRPK